MPVATVCLGAVVAWAVGCMFVRILGYFEFIQLSQALHTTRLAIEKFSSCESSY